MGDDFRLIKSYPLIFRAAGNLQHYPHSPIANYGIECGQGWYPIIEDMASWLEGEAATLKSAGKTPPVIVQVKEKFGTLTIHVNGFPTDRFLSELRPRLDAASERSKTVCELCGAPGSLRKDGHMRTRCDKCDS